MTQQLLEPWQVQAQMRRLWTQAITPNAKEFNEIIFNRSSEVKTGSTDSEFFLDEFDY